MGGVHVATSIALLSLGVTILNIGRELLWPKTTTSPEWVVIAVLALGVVALLAALVIGLRVGPKGLRTAVDGWLAPRDSKAYPDMPIKDLVLQLCPHLVDGSSSKTVPEGEWKRCGDLLNELRQHGRLGRLVLWGRSGANPGHEEHTPLSEIPADFWQKGTLGYLEYLKDGKGRAERSAYQGAREWFDDIWLNRRQVRSAYPAKRSFKLRVPWERIAP